MTHTRNGNAKQLIITQKVNNSCSPHPISHRVRAEECLEQKKEQKNSWKKLAKKMELEIPQNDCFCSNRIALMVSAHRRPMSGSKLIEKRVSYCFGLRSQRNENIQCYNTMFLPNDPTQPYREKK